MQVIQAPSRFDLPLVVLGDLPREQREAALLARRRNEALQAFDLKVDSMLRTSLVRLADEEHVLLLTLHHIAADGWSIRLFWRELELIYAACRRNETPALGELPIQYADYAVWQRERQRGERLQDELAYWRKQLEGLEPLELPTDRARPPQASYQGARHDFEVPRALIDQLRRLSRREGTTLHMTLLAAFQTLLARYSGQEDIAVGVPIAGRQHEELEPLIGFFVNTLVLRTDMSGQPTFRELLGRVRRVSLEAYDHQDLPFEKLVEELNPERDLSRNPLFQVMFQLLESAGGEMALPDLEVSQLPSVSDRVRFDLEMYLRMQSEGDLRGTVVYSIDLFDAATIDRLVGHFQRLLEGIVADPDAKIVALPLLTDAERHRLLIEWNDTLRGSPRNKCVHQLFEEQVRRTPEGVAVVFENRQLAYRELNARSNQLAHYLRDLGVGPEMLVAICLERSLEMVVGLLGILKAGGAYCATRPRVPHRAACFPASGLRRTGSADPEAPAAVLARLPRPRAVPGRRRLDLRQHERRQPSPLATPDALAYVIYTSGSTGVPKGVMIPHRGIVRLVRNTDYCDFGPAQTFLLLAPISFDASTFEIWGPLLNGARLAIMPPGTLALDELGSAIRRYRVTTLWLTASLFHLMVDRCPEDLRSLRQLVAGGDVLSPTHVRTALAVLDDGVVINGYGPTESTTFACCYRMAKGFEVDGSIPIGQPISHTSAYVLDERLQPLPPGVPGELFIGGAGLALGYLNQPELTRERFIPNPFSGESIARLYRTGDRVRLRSDRNLEFLGRIDQQVKIRGYRIEPGEIEVVLGQHPQVRDRAVVARRDSSGENRLVAYVVPRDSVALTYGQLRDYLKPKLPAYMIPSALVVLDAFPLTANGKLDRRALPEPDGKGAVVSGGYTAPGRRLKRGWPSCGPRLWAWSASGSMTTSSNSVGTL